jgi:hypothetical protein
LLEALLQRRPTPIAVLTSVADAYAAAADHILEQS